MKTYTVKRGRYRATRTKVEHPAATKEELRELLTRRRKVRIQAYEDAMARGDLGVIADCLGADLSLEQVLADARRISEPLLRAGLRRPKESGDELEEDGLAFAAEVLYHARGAEEAFRAADEATRAAVVEAVLLGYRWAQLVTNRDNAQQTDGGRMAQQETVAGRRNRLKLWLEERGLRAANLLHGSSNRDAAFLAWTQGRGKGLSRATFLRDVHALIAAGY